MARGVGRTSSDRPVLNELHAVGEPPPSTLAAQLVSRFTDGKKRPKTQDQETFRQLLREVLASDSEQLPQGNTFESSVDVNHKLIYVIVKAGIDVLAYEKPTVEGSALSMQAVDSVAAIEITIRKCPEVLFVTASNQEIDPGGGGPLFVWLLPKLLTLAGTHEQSEIKHGVLALLKSALIAERHAHVKGMKRCLVLRYLKGCIQDLLQNLEAPTSHAAQSRVPAPATITDVYGELVQQDAFENLPELPTKDRSEAVTMTACCLSLVTDLEFKGIESSTTSGSIASGKAWTLVSCTRLWHATAPERLQANIEQMYLSNIAVLLDTLRCFFCKISQIKAEFATTMKTLALIAEVTSSILEIQCLPSTPLTEKALCLSLFELFAAARASSSLCQALSESLSPVLLRTKEQRSQYDAFGQDLQNTISLILYLDNQRIQGNNSSLPQDLVPSFDDREVRQACYKSFCDQSIYPAMKEVHPRKRLRFSSANGQGAKLNARSNLLSRIHMLLGLESSVEISGLKQVAVDSNAKLAEDEQSLLYSMFGELACLSAQSSADKSSDFEKENQKLKCPSCDAEVKVRSQPVPWRDPDLEELFATFANLITKPRTHKFRQPRIAAMMALGRLLSHTTNADHLNLATSAFGQWCLQALQSSLRELRIAAGRTLPIFLRESVGASLASKNSHIALDCLRNLSNKGDLALQETCVLAWGEIARNVADGTEMNLVLIALVKYLGHTNSLVCGLAYDELQRTSNHSPFSALKLFAPYWRTIAVTIVQDLQRRPQIAQQVSELLAMSVPDFLSLTQMYTIPVFVLTKKQDLLQRIADACGQSIMVLCREHNNLAAILSSILLQSSTDVEDLVMALLNAVSPEFTNVDCAELLKSEPQATASELLKFAGDDDEVKRPKTHQALEFLAGITHGKSGSGRGTARKTAVTGPFFESHVLGIMALLADTINDGKGPQPVLEKMRCLGAIREMIKIAKGHVSNGLPQICACLRSAIDNKALSSQGFQAWLVMMSTLGEDDIAALVAPTFAIIVQYWDSFSPDIQGQAYNMVSHLLKAHTSMIRGIVHTLPSLAPVPLMSKFEAELGKLKAQFDVKHTFQSFGQRCQNENATVVKRALEELVEYLEEHQIFLHETANSEQPDLVVSQLARSVLDASVLFSDSNSEICVLCARCLGSIGCLDPTRIEAGRQKRDILVISNFTKDDEIKDFVIFFLRETLIKAFLSATNSRSQGFLAYAMQELLSIGEFESSVGTRSRDASLNVNYRRWVSLPESIRTILTPFLDSKYFVTAGVSQPPCTYPLYKTEMSHSQWLRAFTFDLLKKEVGGGKVRTIFSVLSRIIRFQDISISNFLLPFAVLNVVINGTDSDKSHIAKELLTVLDRPSIDAAPSREQIIVCSQVRGILLWVNSLTYTGNEQTVFQVLDYLSRWMQEKKKDVANLRSPGTRMNATAEAELEKDVVDISSVEAVLNLIPADVISRRAVECKSFARALFHWEQYIRQQRQKHIDVDRNLDLEQLYERLQDIYTQIDEPDGIEGISAHLHVLNIDQQILEHRKAGRWTAVQSWYELLLTERPDDLDVQFNLLTSLRESGQHDVLLNQIQGFQRSDASDTLSLPFATEASWVTGKWNQLSNYLEQSTEVVGGDFNVGIGRALLALIGRTENFHEILQELRHSIVRGLSTTNTTSLQDCHDSMLKLHVITEVEAISGMRDSDNPDKSRLLSLLNRRLDALGPFPSDKQYLLGIRRAAMQLSKRDFSNSDIASAWLTSAKIARKGDSTHHAFNAVLHASQLGDVSATIEHSRLLWGEGNHRKAIQSLEGAIAANAFRSYDYTEGNESMVTNNPSRQQQQNLLKAKAHLLLAKWIDRAGQTQSDVIIHQYKKAAEFHVRWERGHYYLGKHYNKLLESEKAKPPWKQAQTFITGETAKLVVENYIRSLAFGAKYIYQTLPRILTLWLDLGFETEQPLDPKYGNDESFRAHIMAQRRKLLGACNSQMKKYIDRLPAFVFYTALSQIVARICHTNQAVYSLLIDIVAKVVNQHAPQALWPLLAMIKSSSKDRANRGVACMTRILENARKAKSDSGGQELKAFMTQGQKLSDQLLHVCEGDIQGKPSSISLTRDLGFNHKTATCKLAIPLESSLTASLPTVTDNVNMRMHKAFSSSDYIHISTFLDDVVVLNSLQRPRKISIRGSDGHVYALLCKPKDDLRKDQRLMEFNAMINRALKKDADSSKRRLYIKTYAVTPLNEECGLIEWVDNLKTLREILLNSYKQKNVHINYNEIRLLLNESISAPSKLHVFTEKVIPRFPPVFHEWFIEMFPEPGSWFSARLLYTRSCAVMSIVGHVLGLGDRHGENILFEEGNGGTFHVDFNCLFDKGLTFEKPELVPFRLTHNMIDAFGAYGFEGPFRKSCELTLGILRLNEDTLMTILETFLYDPTTDFIGKKKKVNTIVPDTPEGVLESVRNKVRGLLPAESVPLSVEGYTDELIRQATDPWKLASMYIGWCAFF